MIKRTPNWVMYKNSVELSTRKKQILKTMGVPVWSARRQIAGEKEVAHPASAEVRVSENFHDEDNAEITTEASWGLLEQQVTDCKACELHLSRTNAVFGVGAHQADLMIIGEAPGQDEDLQAEPFVGNAGQLLNQMLFALGFFRKDVFIANILKCRPPNNRDPLPEEIIACSGFLTQQINYIKPKVLLSVGGVSAKNILHTDERIGKLRGRVLTHEETSTPLIATYHPAYLLRAPSEKRKVWKDLLLVKKLLNETS